MKQGDLENLIMNALWALQQQAALGNATTRVIDVQLIQDAINEGPRDWAYTTVKTVLDRLVEKGWLKRVKLGKKFCYETLLTQDDAGQQALSKVLRQYFNDNMSLLRETLDAIERESGLSKKSKAAQMRPVEPVETSLTQAPSAQAGQGRQSLPRTSSAGRKTQTTTSS